MTVVAWALCIAALLTNALAIRALFARDRFATWKRRCFTAAAFLFCAIAITTVVGIVVAPREATPTAPDKARRLAEGISEIMNGIAFAALTSALPLVAGFVLRRRDVKSQGHP